MVEREFTCAQIISYILSFDTSEMRPEEELWFKLYSLKSVGFHLGVSTGMTAKRFLYIYSTMANHIVNGEMTAKEARFEPKVRALKELREKHHKK